MLVEGALVVYVDVIRYAQPKLDASLVKFC